MTSHAGPVAALDGGIYCRCVPNWIDHLVLAAPSLESGIEQVHLLTGTAPVFGGRHEGAGTHNALLSLGAPTYLEVLAPDPEQPSTRSALLGDGELTTPRLHGFAVGCDDLDRAVSELRAAGFAEVSDPFAMTRRQPDGSDLAWRLAFIGGTVGGARPFLISWGTTTSPADSTPVGGHLLALRAGDPEPTAVARALEVLEIDVVVEESPTRWLRATIETPAGTVELN